MGEIETEKMIDGKIDLILKILFRNDYKGVLYMDMEKYDDTKFVQELPPKASAKIMKQELTNVMGLINEARELAKDLNNLDIRDEINEELDILEKDRRKVFNNVETETEAINTRRTQFPVELTAVMEGGIGNVSDWA
ncbi:MAG: hypothetical protein WA063_03980 [Minisyncoccia bacterium]